MTRYDGRIGIWLLVAMAVLTATPVAAQAPVVYPAGAYPYAAGVTAVPPVFASAGRPRIGLVLGGGGAKGFAHLGVIAELERRQIPIDVIAGTSMGAVVGSMYAIGNDAAQIGAIAHGIDWVSVFNDSLQRSELTFRRKTENRDILLNFRLGVKDGRPALPRGVLGGQKLFATIQQLFAPWRATENFDDLAIPFRAVATNIVTGDAVAMGAGNLSTAVFASMAIPGAFPPLERGGLLLVDGGISNNLPVDVARAMGVDIVIVVDVGEPPAAADKLTSALGVLNQMQLLLGYDAIRRQRASLGARDVLIEPDITGLSPASFDRLDDAIARGRAAAVQAGDRLAALTVSDAQWAAYLAQRDARRHPAPIRIDNVRIANDSTVKTRDIAPLVTTRPGDVLDGRRMATDVAKIYALDEFDRVDYHIDTAPGNNVLVVNALGNRGSGKYFQTGLILASDFGKAATFDLAVGYTDRDFLGTGAEWRGYGRVGSNIVFDVSLYRQFGGLFIEPTAFVQRGSALSIRQESSAAVDILQAARAGAGVDGGMVFGKWGELRAGVRLGGVNPVQRTPQGSVPPGWQRDVDWRVGFTVDTLDSQTFPRSGGFAQVQFIDHVTTLGGKFTRNTLNFNGQKAFSWDRTTMLLGARLGTTSTATNDFIGDYQLGGFLNLSGLPRNSLVGRQQLLGRMVVYHRFGKPAPILDLPIYVGGSIEVGNVWDFRSQISLGSLRTAASAFVAADTIIGPVWLAYGQSGDSSSVYLVIGRVF